MSVYSGGRGAGAFSEVDAGAGGVFWGAGVDMELYVESFPYVGGGGGSGIGGGAGGVGSIAGG